MFVNTDRFPQAQEAGLKIDVGLTELEQAHMLSPQSGSFIMELHDAAGQLVERREYKNVITNDSRLLAARLFMGDENINGMYFLGVGQGARDKGPGDLGFNPLSPEIAQADQRALARELARKPFSNKRYVNPADGTTSSVPTRLVDVTAVFGPADAVGPLTEMGVYGAPINTDPTDLGNTITPPFGTSNLDITQYDTLVNYKTFQVFHKPNGATLTITWRFQF